MKPHDDRVFGPGPHDDLNPCEFHTSDGWVLVDAMLAILTGVATIVLVVFRRPLRIFFLVVAIATIGAIAGWWAP